MKTPITKPFKKTKLNEIFSFDNNIFIKIDKKRSEKLNGEISIIYPDNDVKIISKGRIYFNRLKTPKDKKQLADKPANARIFKQVLTSPYYENENGTLKTVFNIRGKAGVYMIYHKGELRYIGLASDIYKTMYHHLGKQVWNNSKQYRAIYKDIENVKVRVIYTKTFEIAKRLEAGLIFKYNPPDNYNTYEDFEPDEKEKEMVNDFLDAKGQPIAQYKGDLPF